MRYEAPESLEGAVALLPGPGRGEGARAGEPTSWCRSAPTSWTPT